MSRKIVHIGIAALILLVGAGLTRWTSSRSTTAPDPGASPEPTGPDPVTFEAGAKVPLRRPPSEIVELGVWMQSGAVDLDRAKLAEAIVPSICGDAAACAAVRATLGDERATTLRLTTPAEWTLGGPSADADPSVRRDQWTAAAIVHVATSGSKHQLALRTAFATAAILAERAAGIVVDPILGRAEDARAFAAHAITEPLDASVFRADRIRVDEEPAGDGLLRLRTAGLARWGAPDVEALAVPVVARHALRAVVLGVAAALADGAESSPVALSRTDLEAANAPDGGARREDADAGDRVDVDLVSVADDRAGPPDANDFLARIEPPGGEGPLAYVELGERLFGSVLAPSDETTHRSDQARAAQMLTSALDRTAGARPGVKILVRLPFDIPGGGREAVWVEVTGHDARTITGRIDDDPLAATDVERGQEVTRPRGDVEDVRLR